MAGAQVTRCDLRVAPLATVDLTGRRVYAVVSRGKHLLMRLGAVLDGPAVTLHSHLRMQGRWQLAEAGRSPGGRPHEWRALLRLADGRTLVGHRLPVLDLVAADREHTVVGHLGPDVLGPDWDAGEAVRRLAAAPGRPVVEALLDQRNLAGPGNLYAVECAFLARTDPRAPVGDVDLDRLVGVVHTTMCRQVASGHQATTGLRGRGRDHWVYGRAGRPCRRCGARIVFAPPRGLRGRPLWWCPGCQRTRPVHPLGDDVRQSAALRRSTSSSVASVSSSR